MAPHLAAGRRGLLAATAVISTPYVALPQAAVPGSSGDVMSPAHISACTTSFLSSAAHV